MLVFIADLVYLPLLPTWRVALLEERQRDTLTALGRLLFRFLDPLSFPLCLKAQAPARWSCATFTRWLRHTEVLLE